MDAVCHREVTRDHIAEPCDEPATALALDEEGDTYPTCRRHRGHALPLLLANRPDVAHIGVGAAIALMEVSSC